MTINNDTGPIGSCNWNENNLNTLTRIYERASLVPAAAVIPALMAYIVIAAVKKLVVGSVPMCVVSPSGLLLCLVCVGFPAWL